MAVGSLRLHGSRQTNAYVCILVTFATATISIVLRLIARRLTRISLWLDDYLAIIAFLFAGAWSGLVIWCKNYRLLEKSVSQDTDV
jgi:hypothetical protein